MTTTNDMPCRFPSLEVADSMSSDCEFIMIKESFRLIPESERMNYLFCKLEDLCSEKERLISEFKRFEDEGMSLHRTVQTLEIDKRNVSDWCDQLQREVSELQEKNRETSTSYNESESRVQFLMDRVVALLSQNGNSESLHTDTVMHMCDDAKRNSAANEELKASLDVIRSQNKELAQRLSEEQCLATRLHDQLMEAQNKFLIKPPVATDVLDQPKQHTNANTKQDTIPTIDRAIDAHPREDRPAFAGSPREKKWIDHTDLSSISEVPTPVTERLPCEKDTPSEFDAMGIPPTRMTNTATSSTPMVLPPSGTAPLADIVREESSRFEGLRSCPEEAIMQNSPDVTTAASVPLSMELPRLHNVTNGNNESGPEDCDFIPPLVHADAPEYEPDVARSSVPWSAKADSPAPDAIEEKKISAAIPMLRHPETVAPPLNTRCELKVSDKPEPSLASDSIAQPRRVDPPKTSAAEVEILLKHALDSVCYDRPVIRLGVGLYRFGEERVFVQLKSGKLMASSDNVVFSPIDAFIREQLRSSTRRTISTAQSESAMDQLSDDRMKSIRRLPPPAQKSQVAPCVKSDPPSMLRSQAASQPSVSVASSNASRVGRAPLRATSSSPYSVRRTVPSLIGTSSANTSFSGTSSANTKETPRMPFTFQKGAPPIILNTLRLQNSARSVTPSQVSETSEEASNVPSHAGVSSEKRSVAPWPIFSQPAKRDWSPQPLQLSSPFGGIQRRYDSPRNGSLPSTAASNADPIVPSNGAPLANPMSLLSNSPWIGKLSGNLGNIPTSRAHSSSPIRLSGIWGRP